MSRINFNVGLTGPGVLRHLAEILPHLAHHLAPATPLRALTLDSLDLVELLCVVESEFAVRVSDDDLAATKTVGELAKVIAARTQ